MSITRYPVTGASGSALSGVDRQVFTGPGATGLWVKPTGASIVRVQLVGGGGGGGGGWASSGTNQRGGGAGGAGGMYVEAWYPADDLPSSMVVSVGTGGSGGGGGFGGVAGTGGTGTTGGVTSFGTLIKAMSQHRAAQGGFAGGSVTTPGYSAMMNPGGGADLGTTDPFPEIAGGGNFTIAVQVARDGQFIAFGSNGLNNQPCGGAGGGGIASAGVTLAPGVGLTNLALQDANVAQPGTLPSPNATPVATPKTLADVAYGSIPYYGGAGGSVASGVTAGSTTGGTGGNGSPGQGYGAGGGGGGAGSFGTSPSPSGPGGVGGNGAPGIAIITSY